MTRLSRIVTPGAVTAMPPMEGRPAPLQAALSSRAGSALPPSTAMWSSTLPAPASVIARAAGPPAAAMRSTSTAQPPAAQSGAPAVVSVTGRRSSSGRVTT